MFINKYSSELIAGFISLVVGYFLHKATSQRPINNKQDALHNYFIII